MYDVQDEFIPFQCTQIDEILSKPLCYLGKGLQSIAFVSSDGQYVLKFFLVRNYTNRFCFHFPWVQRKNRRFSKKKVLFRYSQAFCKLRKETGLLAAHLGADGIDLPECRIIDERGYLHRIDLARASFVVQKRGDLVSDLFQNMSPQRLAALEELLESIASKRFVTLGKHFNPNNFAFVDEQAIMIDVGRIVYFSEQNANPEKEILHRKDLLDLLRN